MQNNVKYNVKEKANESIVTLCIQALAQSVVTHVK